MDLPEPETPGHGDEPSDREVDVDALQVVHRRAADREPAALVVLAPRRNEDPALAAQERTSHRPRRLRDRLRETLADDLTAVLARAGPEIDHPVGRAHHLLVVLDDEDGVADVAELLERVDEPSVVALVQPDRGLVEDVEDADELRPDLRRQPQPLSLAARQRLRRPVELEIADADVLEEHQPLAHLLEDAPTDELLGLRQLELVDEPQRTCDRHLREPVDREVADRHREHLGLESRSMALGARSEAHVLLDAVARMRRVRLAVAPLQVVEETLERHRVLALPAHPVAVRDEDLLGPRPVQEPILLLGRRARATARRAGSRSAPRSPRSPSRRSSGSRSSTGRAHPLRSRVRYPEREDRGRSRAARRARCSGDKLHAAS